MGVLSVLDTEAGEVWMVAPQQATILVIDDEFDVREMIEIGLELNGYRVLTADGGERGIALAKRCRVDLAISDLRMPGMSGGETIAQLRALAPRLPIILVSGYLDADAEAQYEELAGVVVVRKPFPFRTLADAVERSLARGD